MALMTEPFTRKAKEAQRKFFNKMQRMGMAIAAHDEYWVCSRGTGKSEGLDARFIIRNVCPCRFYRGFNLSILCQGLG